LKSPRAKEPKIPMLLINPGLVDTISWISIATSWIFG